ncbi:MAG: hypothetical protein K8R79_00810 [Calditrichales bacterium]|nr:hypothetical protein [Calditrichales bacterium]
MLFASGDFGRYVHDMKTTFQKLTFILGIVVLTAAVFIGGSMFGASQNFMEGLLNNLLMENALLEATIAFRHIENIDQGNIEKAKESMNLFLDSHIITIDQLVLDSPNEKYKKRAKRFLARIAKHRKKHPVPERTIKPTQGEMNTSDIIQEILDKSLE